MGTLCALPLLLLTVLAGSTQSDDAKLQSVLNGVVASEQQIKNFDVDYTLRMEFPNPVPYLYPGRPNRPLSQSHKGHLVYQEESFVSAYEGESKYEKPLDTGTDVWAIGNKTSFDGKDFIEMSLDEKKATVKAKPGSPTINPLSCGFLVTGGSKLAGKLMEFNRISWSYVGPETISEIQCECIEGTDPESGTVNRLWVAPEKGYRMVRFEASLSPSANPKMGELTEVRVCESKDLVEVSPGVWLPRLLEGTTTGRTPGGEETEYIRERLEITIKSVNATYPPDFFRLKIPPGCRVLDETLKTLYKAGEMDVKKDLIQESAQGLEKDTGALQPVPTTSGPSTSRGRTKPAAVSDTISGRTIWPVVLIGLAVGILGVAAVMSKRKRSS